MPVTTTTTGPELDFPVITPQKEGAENDAPSLARRRREVKERVKEFVQITYNDLRVASRKETEDLLKGTEHITAQDIEGWETYVNGTMKDQIHSARVLYEQLTNPLLEALQDKAISERVVTKIFNEFSSADISYKQKEWYVQSVFPERLKEWYRVKKERDDLEKEFTKAPHLKKLMKKDGITHFQKLFDKDAFAKLEWKERKKLVEETAARMAAKRNNTEQLMPDIQTELEGYAAEQIMHKTKVSAWMKRIFVNNKTPEQIETFMQKIVRPNADRWRAVKQDYDNLHAEMGSEIPRGFRPVSPKSFLLKDYKQRTSYCDHLRLLLENIPEQDKMLAALKLRVRHNIDTEDWAGAQEELTKAYGIRPRDPELDSMKEFITCHCREEEEEQEEEELKPSQHLEALREMVGQLPREVQDLYAQAMMDGPAVANRLFQVMYNRVWLHEVAGWDARKERQQIGFLRATGQQGKGTLLDMETMGTEATLNQIRDHADANAGKTPPNLSSDEHWGYWATLVPNIPIEQSRMIVKGMHWHMKRHLRALNEAGFAFTLIGPPVSRN